MALQYLEYGIQEPFQKTFYDEFDKFVQRRKGQNKELLVIIETTEITISFVWDSKFFMAAYKKSSGINIIVYVIQKSQFLLLEESLFKQLEGNSNFILFPNNLMTDYVFPSYEKILDCVICKTIRTRYKSIQVSNKLNVPDLNQHIRDFDLLSKYFRNADLNPSLFDGFISKKIENGLLITSSRTNKYNFNKDRICFVEDVNSASIKWHGLNQPSSETFCAFFTFLDFPDTNYLLHFHNKRITYSSKFDCFRSKEYVSYGTKDEADKLVEQFKLSGKFSILNGHGEFFRMGSINETGELEALLKQHTT